MTRGAGGTPLAPPVDVGCAPELVEAVVRMALDDARRRGDERLEAAYHRQADGLYALPPGEREAGFHALHRRWFRELGIEGRLGAVLARHGALLARLAALRLVPAAGADDEGAELGAPGTHGRRALVRLRPRRALESTLEPFLDHELTRLADRLDPAFGEDPSALARVPAPRRRVVEARMRLAWATSVDGRLARRGLVPLADRGEHRRRLEASFALEGGALEALLERLWAGIRPSYAELLALAGRAGGRQPGTPCPVCGFPTCAWAEGVGPALAEAVRAEAPWWDPAQGLCMRCVEGYLARKEALWSSVDARSSRLA